MAVQSQLRKVLDLAESFVSKHKGQWNHADWEQLVEDARKLGYPCNEDECKRHLGNMLESCKYFYNFRAGDGATPAKKPATRKRAVS